jgi:hypothetical protein
MRTAVEAPDEADQPWLTRTESRGVIEPTEPASGAARVEDPPPGRPPADYRTTGRGSSRSDEIRGTDDRPWIGLPIEPDDTDRGRS